MSQARVQNQPLRLAKYSLAMLGSAVVPAACLLLAFVPQAGDAGAARAEPGAETLPAYVASFSGELQLGGEDGPAISLSGALTWDEPNMRLEVTDALTQEQMVLLLDFDAERATVLYPDTLNGYSTTLSLLDNWGILPSMRDYLNGEWAETPEGFAREELGDVELDGVLCTRLHFEREDGLSLDWWLDDGRPLRLEARTERWTLTVEVNGYATDMAVPDDAFTYGECYTVIEEDEPGGIPAPPI
ncbi:hypothetical protein IIA79_08220 [bacterium]|nr:hypothetical protein [bacterium]